MRIDDALGYTGQDKISGFRGVVTGVCKYISGCNQILLAPKSKSDGDFVTPQWFDWQRVVIEPRVAPVKLDNSETPGSDRAAPVR